MSSEPPSENSQMHGEGVAAESSDPSGNQGGGRWTSVAGAIGVLVVAGGVAAFLFVSSDPDPPNDQAASAQGLACPDLRTAADAYERDDRAAFDRAVAQAAEVAEQTLQTSGQVFGEPERIAVELSLRRDRPRADIVRLLDAARAACSENPAQS